MRRIPLASMFAAAVWIARAIAADPPAAVPPVLVERTPAAPPASSSASQGMSPQMATKLASVVTKFTPAPRSSDSTNAKPAAPASDPARSAAPDHPQNTIVRLPSYVVEEQKVPRMAERDMRTTKARLELAYKRYPGLRFPFTFLNNAVALDFLADDDAAERAKEMADLYNLYAIHEPAPPSSSTSPPAPPKK